MKKSLFGTSGIRGSAEDLFTNQFSFDLGRTFSIFLKNHQETGWVAIGMDPRDSSPRIKSYVIKGLIYEGREIYDEGVAPVPAMNWILKVEPAFSGSIMISGSHIKAELNGAKFFAFGEEILKEHEEEINSIYSQIRNQIEVIITDNNNFGEAVIETRAKDSYIEYLLSKSTRPYPEWKVVVDPGNGAQSEVAPEVLQNLSLSVVPLNVSVQKNFLSRDTEVGGDFLELQKAVTDNKADFGVGFDSDGDRVIFVDEKGVFISGDYSGTLIAKHLDPKKVVTPINTSQVIDKVGLEVFRTKVGSPFVVQKLKEENIPFGFEANGGGIFENMRSRDGGRSMIEFLNLLKKNGGNVTNLVSKLPKYFLFRDKVEYKWELKDKIIDEARKEFSGIKVEELDGIKFWQDKNTWILFRSSMNAPEFRVFAESDDEDKAKKLITSGMALVERIVNE
jgi:phosphomannomutase/phosphoglucomutase